MELRQIPNIMENQEGENKNTNNEFKSHEFIHFIADLIEHLCISCILLSKINIFIISGR